MSSPPTRIWLSPRRSLRQRELPATLVFADSFGWLSEMAPPPPPSCSASSLRRLAGSDRETQTEKLLSALEGWDAKALDTAVDGSGKGPLHLASWRGHVRHVEALLAKGMDINAVATGEFSCGKTPIFFAITRGRDEVVEFLLERGARVRIVNNKGQTPRSLAVSHLRSFRSLIEKEDQEDEWINYRETHSDGCVYGDLDVRFLERPQLSSDVVEDVCVNPTTKYTRKGNFQRNNPTKVYPAKPVAKPRRQRPRDDETVSVPSLDSYFLIDEDVSTIIARIVADHSTTKGPWLPDAADALATRFESRCLEATLADANGMERRLLRRALNLNDDIKLVDDVPEPSNRLLLERMTAAGRHLLLGADAVGVFETRWIDDAGSLDEAATEIAAAPVIAMDAEFDDTGIAVFQVAVPGITFVIDCISLDSATFFRTALNRTVLGFAPSEDIRRLQRRVPDLDVSGILDVQDLAIAAGIGSTNHRPSLARVAHDVLGLHLDKSLQCSDWTTRPLLDSQLQYAALDAAVLLQLVPAIISSLSSSSSSPSLDSR